MGIRRDVPVVSGRSGDKAVFDGAAVLPTYKVDWASLLECGDGRCGEDVEVRVNVYLGGVVV